MNFTIIISILKPFVSFVKYCPSLDNDFLKFIFFSGQLAIIEQKLGHIPGVIVFCREALQIYREHGDLMYQALLLGKLGDLFVIQENYNEALYLLTQLEN